MKAAIVLFPAPIARATPCAPCDRLAPKPISSGTPNTICRREPISSCCPAGFSYGDYLRCGAIAGRAHVMDAVRAHAARGGFVLGICNGFQILCESGLLPGVLMRNRDLRFICKRQHLRVERNDTAFTRAYALHQAIDVAIAHGEGNYKRMKRRSASLKAKGASPFAIATPMARRRRRQSERLDQSTLPGSIPRNSTCSA